MEFLAGADLVIHDAQYTLEEYPSKLTWGHSPAELAVDFALAAGVKRLALFHHDPLRDDAALDQLVETCRRRAVTGGLDVFAAAEGQTIELAEREAVTSRAARQPKAAIAKGVGAASATILLVDDDPDIVRLLTMTSPARGLPPVVGERRERGAGDRPRRAPGPSPAGLEHAWPQRAGGVPRPARRVRPGPPQTCPWCS